MGANEGLCRFTLYYTWALLGLECPPSMPKSYLGLLGKSSRKVALGVLKRLGLSKLPHRAVARSGR